MIREPTVRMGHPQEENKKDWSGSQSEKIEKHWFIPTGFLWMGGRGHTWWCSRPTPISVLWDYLRALARLGGHTWYQESNFSWLCTRQTSYLLYCKWHFDRWGTLSCAWDHEYLGTALRLQPVKYVLRSFESSPCPLTNCVLRIPPRHGNVLESRTWNNAWFLFFWIFGPYIQWCSGVT